MALQLRSRHRNLTNRSLNHLFCTKSSSSSNPSDPKDPSDTKEPTDANPQSHSSSLSSYFSDVKASLRQHQQQQQPLPPPEQRRPTPQNPSYPNPSPSRTSKVASLEEIRKNLSEYRRRTSVPDPTESGPAASQHSSTAPGIPQQISFQELYKRNVLGKAEGGNANSDRKLSFDTIRESLRKIKNPSVQNDRKDPLSLSRYTESLRLEPNQPNMIGGTGTPLPSSIFGKELREEKNAENGSNEMKTNFVKMYSYAELGEKLRKLRPDEKGQNWFSLEELNERLMKLREMEEKETQAAIGNLTFRDLRESLVKLQMSDQEKAKKSSIQRIDVLSHIGRTPNFMLQPPKENLVEKYFHPDNMSSAEKLKLELAKVRDEFKMSESDCGSARVQGQAFSEGSSSDGAAEEEVIEVSSKNWDSYCLVLSKLGLRYKENHKN